MFLLLLEVMKYDNCAKNDFVLAENEMYDRFAEAARRWAADGECLSVGDLAVDGNDMLAIGLKGSSISHMLGSLLDSVFRGELPNEHDALIDAAIQRKSE